MVAMRLKIKQMNGNDFEVGLDNEDPSVLNLLEAIATKLDISVDCQRLIFSGRVSHHHQLKQIYLLCLCNICSPPHRCRC
jgi:hypothetical protein